MSVTYRISVFFVNGLVFVNGILFSPFGKVLAGYRVSETIYNTYESTINQTISSAERISVAEEDDSTIDKFVSWIKDAAGTVVDYVTGLLSRFVEAVAVMLVTSCLIPILVIIFLAWLVKVFFKVDFSLSDAERLIKKRERKLLEDSEEQ